MDFYDVIKKIDELKKELKQTSFSPLEKDIIKSKISETYLFLFEKQEVLSFSATEQPSITQPPTQEEIIVEEKTATFTPQTTIQPPEQEIQPKKSLNVDYKTLVDAFLEKEPPKQTAPEDQSLLSKISQTKIVDLKRSIAMNDRFIFIKELFQNDFDAYNRYINDLNECQTLQQAEQYLSQLKQQYQWDEKNETAQYFITLVGRKF